VQFATYVPALGILLLGVAVVWGISTVRQNVTYIDTWWGVGFLVVSVYYASTVGFSSRSMFILLLVALWSLRLSIYLFYRNHVQHSEEDRRYAKMRAKTGASFWWRSLYTVFLPQAVVQFVVSTPLLLAMQSEPEPSLTTPKNSRDGLVFDLCGIVLYAIGLYFEVAADRQLANFMANKDNAGKLLTTGVWSLSRHPNYFGDSCVWWGFWLLASHSSAVWPGGLFTVYAPLIMTYALRYVTGVTLLELTSYKRKAGYDEYCRSTPAFIPTFSKLFK